MYFSDAEIRALLRFESRQEQEKKNPVTTMWDYPKGSVPRQYPTKHRKKLLSPDV
jgi:hypothetical protein